MERGIFTKTKTIILIVILSLVGIGILGGALFFFSQQAMPVVSEATPSPSVSPDVTPTPMVTTTPDAIRLEESKANYEKGLALFEQKKYSEAEPYFKSVIEDDGENYVQAQEKLQKCMAAITEGYCLEGKELLKKTLYLKAEQLIDDALELYPESPELKELKEEAHRLATTLVKYEGPVYHVFFHSLIVYPELCFTGDSMERGYNYWMTTVYEFKLMLEEMHSRGYTLIDLRDMFSTNDSGKVVKNDIMLPEGKKPLIISVDDVSYYKYMDKDGFADKLVFDEEGNVATLVKTPEGKEIVTRDGDVVPILDDFVKANPDFSYNGAKGVLALTGYEGILGYNTLHDNPDWEKEQTLVQPIVDKLKATGWAFANHSFTHRRTYSERTITLDYLKYDMERWLKEVGSILGPTNLYISPFGATFKKDDPRHRYIVSKGFNVYCGVGARAFYEFYGDNVFMERINLDGYKMFHSPQVLKELFDVEKVYDPVRPPMK